MKYKLLDKLDDYIEKDIEERGSWNILKKLGLSLFCITGYVACGAGIISENPYIQGNLNDSFLIGAYYFSLRAGPIKRSHAALATFCLATLSEFGQYVGVFNGTFDPKDIAAYAVGVGVALGIDHLIEKKKDNLESIVEKPK
ncbi:MAG: hypothetical protein KKA79_09330 [Nanoarchaeota archaeon]|nr:hypothetical protein [Nanoarchaeota archaeon]MCG2719025.1 hypothetical protein [Nanoarchaeota archaeon]